MSRHKSQSSRIYAGPGGVQRLAREMRDDYRLTQASAVAAAESVLLGPPETVEEDPEADAARAAESAAAARAKKAKAAKAKAATVKAAKAKPKHKAAKG